MDKSILLPEKRVPVKGVWDVIVCGGGVAGIAASLSAKRAGAKKVLLLEREFILGGLATAGLVTIYLPLCDGRGTQVSFGIAEELMRLSVSKGAEEKIPDCWLKASDKSKRTAQRYVCRFNAGVFACLAEELLCDSSVDILCGEQVVDAIKEGDTVRAVACANRAGEYGVYEARGFVDASGDATVFRLAGAKTYDYPLGNRQAAWYYSFDGNRNTLHTVGSAPEPGERVKGGFTGLTSEELSGVMINTHRLAAKHFFGGGDLSNGHALTALPSIPQVRMSRRIEGQTLMTRDDAFRRAEDSVGLISDWRKSGPIYELPLSALKSEFKNLFAAGRMISADDAMWDITRVIPCCAVSGEASGIAAFIGNAASDVQAELNKRAVPCHISELTTDENQNRCSI